ncbi:MAG: tetratricopeptide repeat protein [Rhodobacteraceae bacterium]|nr:tetratricopeptide repeat protein [Paracoccaceae bacterium]
MDRNQANLVSHIRALFNAGKWEIAEAKLEEALKQYPSEYAFLELMGVAKLNLKNPKDAVRFFKKAIKKAPKQAMSYMNLASAEIMIGALPNAQATIIKALKLDPRCADAWMLQGDIHTAKEQNDKAVECYTKASRLQPDSLKFAVKLLVTLELQNKIDDLEQQIKVFEARAADHPVFKLFKGIVRIGKSDFAEAKNILESISFDSQNTAQFHELELMRVRALGLTADKLHLEVEAVGYFAQAKALNRSFHRNPPPPEAFWEVCEMREAYTTNDAMKSWVYPSPHLDEPVFIVGFPRSGTTLLDTFLRGHKGLALLEEVPAVSKMRFALGTSANHSILALDKLDEKTISLARKAYFAEVRAHKPKGLVIDKLPMNLVFASEILRVFPRAKFILALRDPADAVLSCFMQSFRLNPPMATLDSAADAAKTYALSMQIWQNTVKALSPACVTTRYEDLISNPEETLRPIVSFLGVEWDEAMLDHQATAQARGHINTPSRTQVVKPLYQSAVARWERYAQLMPEAVEILAPWRKEFGYSD